MSNSPLISYTKLSPNHSGKRKNKIDTITIHCLPIKETELLTPNGWVNLGEVKQGDIVAASDDSCNIKFEPVLQVIEPHKEDIYKFSNGFGGTAGHRVLMKTQDRYRNNQPFIVRTVEEVAKRRGTTYVPNAGYYEGAGLGLTKAEIEFLCAVQADGYYEKNDDETKIYTIRLKFCKERKIQQMEELIAATGYEYSISKSTGSKNYEFSTSYRVKDPRAISLCEKYLDNKRFNYNLLEMSQEEAEWFAEGITLWDGFVRRHGEKVEKRFNSNVKQNIDVVAAVLATHGIGTIMPPNGQSLTYKPTLCRTLGKPELITTEKDVDVSCVTVPSGFILIRQYRRTTIVGNCMAGNLSVESCGNVFASSSRKASSNYGIGSDGRIALYVDEANRSWCTSSSANDNRAVTIEVANTSSKDPWPCSDAAYNALIDLVTDICQRNGIKKLVWSTNKNDRVNHLNGCNMTVHRDYAAKACPGDWLYNRHGQIAEEVNARLGSGSTSSTTVSYQVKVVSSDGTLNCRSSASASSSIVKTYTNGTILTITKESGNWGYTGEGWISLKYTAPAAPTNVKEEEEVTQEQFNEMMNTYLETLAAKDPTWEKEYMERAQAEGLVVGDEQGRLMPKKLMTRGEMLTVILRLEDKLK